MCCLFFFPLGEGFADFKSVSADDGFTDFKTANSVSPLDPPDQAKIFQPAFPPPFSSQSQPPAALAQPKNPLNMADLDLFTSVNAPASALSTVDSKAGPFSSASSSAALPSLAIPPAGPKPASSTGANDDFGDFTLFGSTSSDMAPSGQRGPRGAVQDDFADFMAFGRPGEQRSENSSQQRQAPASDKYDVFKQLSLEGGLAYDDGKEGCGGSYSSLKSSDADDFADFQSSKFCTALGASEKSLADKVAAFKQTKEDSASVKSLDLPSIGGSSAGGKDDSEDALSVQLDMKLADVGGDLKHGTSDSSLDLPGLTAHQPPAAGEELVRLLW